MKLTLKNITKTPNGYEILACDPDFAKKMEIARRGIKKYRNALINLAQGTNPNGSIG